MSMTSPGADLGRSHLKRSTPLQHRLYQASVKQPPDNAIAYYIEHHRSPPPRPFPSPISLSLSISRNLTLTLTLTHIHTAHVLVGVCLLGMRHYYPIVQVLPAVSVGCWAGGSDQKQLLQQQQQTQWWA